MKTEIDIKHKFNDNQYHILGMVNNQLAIILIDKGTCMSHITSNLVQEVYESENVFKYIDSMGKEKEHNKISEINILISKELVIKLEVLVDYQERDKEVLLGIDFLEHFDYFSINKKELILGINQKEFKIPRIRMNPHHIREIIH